jgi:hypothetical protein
MIKKSQFQKKRIPEKKGLEGESMVFYTKKVDEKISSLKKDDFSQKHKKINSIFTSISF